MKKLRITTKMEGFRRAGMNHYGTREYDAGHFTGQQLAAIEAEPMLDVECLEEDEPETGAEAPESESPAPAPENDGEAPKEPKPGKTTSKGKR